MHYAHRGQVINADIRIAVDTDAGAVDEAEFWGGDAGGGGKGEALEAGLLEGGEDDVRV